MAADYGAELTVGETEITFHVLVIIGGIFFVIAVIAGLVMLYYRVGLPFLAFLTRVALPIIFTGGAGMCAFAFLGWAAGQRLAITQTLSLIGALSGFVCGWHLFGQPGKETGPVRMSDFM